MQMDDKTAKYSPAAQLFHWVTVAFVLVMVPVGVIMADRGENDLWDGTTNALYSSHKLAGFTLMLILIARLGYRLIRGAPPVEASLPPWQRTVSHITHWAMYAVLLAMVLTGWLGVSLLPALDIFGLFSLPAITGTPDPAAAKLAFSAHEFLGFALVGLVTLHVAAALHHHFIRKDGVLRRMMPGKG